LPQSARSRATHQAIAPPVHRVDCTSTCSLLVRSEEFPTSGSVTCETAHPGRVVVRRATERILRRRSLAPDLLLPTHPGEVRCCHSEPATPPPDNGDAPRPKPDSQLARVPQAKIKPQKNKSCSENTLKNVGPACPVLVDFVVPCRCRMAAQIRFAEYVSLFAHC
jgi:hypothetical protein